VGLIKGRKFRQVKVTRPRFNAGSIKFADNKTWALARFDCLISSRSPSGQFSESAANGAEMAAGTTGICGAGEGMGGATGFGAPLLRGVGACGMNGGGGGLVALVAGVMARETNENDGGVVMRNGGMAVDGVGLAATEILAPSPPAPNGPVMSSVTSTCFWAERRQQSGIQPGEDFIERQHHWLVVMLAAGIDEHARSGRSQFTESDFHGAKRELRENFFQRNSNHHPCGRCLHDFRAQFHRHRGKD
jgi:hypothetical protein